MTKSKADSFVLKPPWCTVPTIGPSVAAAVAPLVVYETVFELTGPPANA